MNRVLQHFMPRSRVGKRWARHLGVLLTAATAFVAVASAIALVFVRIGGLQP
jgi:hypothetical protein